MRIELGQHMRLEQRMKLAPRMIQSMEILQMPQVALEARIEQELSSNPTLELREVTADPEEIEAERKQQERDAREGERELTVRDDAVDPNHADDFERLGNLSEAYGETWAANTYETAEPFRRYRDTGERDGKMDAMANTAARPLSLTDQLLAQWGLVEAEPEIQKAGEFLIGFIDDDGYLRQTITELLQQTPPGISSEHLEAALVLLRQTLEPVGIGAGDLRQCLLMQIDAKIAQQGSNGDQTLRLPRLLISEYIKEIANNRLPQIAKSAGYSLDQVKLAIDGLKQFYFHPGRLLIDDDTRTITPDAIVEYDEELDRYVAVLCNGRLPSLQISDHYGQMAGDKTIDRKTREFIGNNLRSARWLIDAIAQRHQTLMRVINVVLEAQRDYFDQGPQALHPLPMTMVADQLGIHVATVSRAVADKYLQTPRGVVRLRMFFSGGTETEDGDAMSWAAIQAKLQQIVDEEDKTKPLNDDELVEKLKEKGIEIARRTVAKYRKQLDIPPARQRRQY